MVLDRVFQNAGLSKRALESGLKGAGLTKRALEAGLGKRGHIFGDPYIWRCHESVRIGARCLIGNVENTP